MLVKDNRRKDSKYGRDRDHERTQEYLVQFALCEIQREQRAAVVTPEARN